MTRTLAAALAAVALAAGPAAAQLRTPLETLRSSAEVLDEFRDLYLKRIPPALLTEAEAVAVIPRVVKAGLLIGGRHGHGLVLHRTPGGGWSDPTFIRLTGASIGFQAGVESADVVLVFRSKKDVDRLLDGRRKLTLGADAAVAAGPLGREAGAGTDARLRAEIYSYSRSRGLFAGVSLAGAVLASDAEANQSVARDTRPEVTRAVADLKTRLAEYAPARPTPSDLPRK
ncbi:MAG TPA: lipid-binding SYLF domain-containing protein [Fimbriiglobus sp.]|jgi:lipid-binding SYLF domain-containing protein|nr:lipid-binding SYLF domain-containing protein [Fimbriiglobus sp.]